MPHSHRHLHNHRDVLRDVRDIVDSRDSLSGNQSPEHIMPRADGDSSNGQTTVVRFVYKTMSKTFPGEAAGYKTVTKDTDTPKATHAAQKKPATSEEPKVQQAKGTPVPPKQPSSTVSKVSKAPKKTSSIPTAIDVPDKTTELDSVLAKATGHATLSPSSNLGGNLEMTKTSAHASITPTANSASTTDTADASTSPGAKAGIAFGVLGGVLLVGLLVFFLFNRRRKQSKERARIDEEDEKFRAAGGANANPFEPVPALRSNPKAPRISLRPVTQFLPNWNPEKRASKGAAMSLTPAAAAAAWDRPGTSQSSHSANPFGNQAERVPSPVMENANMQNVGPHDGRPDDTVPDLRPRQDPLTANGPGLATGAGGGAGGLMRKASMRKDGPSNLDLTLPVPQGQMPSSPAGTEFSMSSVIPDAGPAPSAGAAAIAASGGPANSAVHRVQLDFKPTLEDEMGLNAGDLVRLLHEYDDGWALCIRLDRSQQGVVPRTCLSTRPVKPRPQGGPRPGPPVNPNGHPRGSNFGPGGRPGPPPPGQRPMTPQGQRPMTPQGMPVNRMGPGPRPASPAGRPMGPNGRSQSPMGRPMSPGPRAQSPGPRQRGPPGGRPQSPSNMNRRMTPPGSSPMNPAQSPPQGPPTGPVGRKPVPGQAY